MKVTNNKISSTDLAATSGRGLGETKRARAGDKSAINAGDIASSSKVSVSDRAHMMQKAKEAARTDTVDEAKVARLQALIDAGKYQVDASKVADKLVDEHLIMHES